MSRSAEDLVGGLTALSLEELDARAALLQRADRKYLLGWDAFATLLDRLAADHDVLEIGGRRVFAYSTVYFDSPDLRCFHDHVEGRRPRFKARTRLYRDTGGCQFEVKLATADGRTDKRQVEHPVSRAAEVTPEAERLVREALSAAGMEPPGSLGPVLRTGFDRVTLAARDAAARVTCDLGVAMERLDGATARIRDSLVLVESKSEDGRASADAVLAELGCSPVSLSKYRAGIDLLVERDRSGDMDAIRERFVAPVRAGGGAGAD